ncbi:MAG TPA: DUF2306 domain-containing protein [Candidatus Angelobacter sp.]|nr:DUF2306 domain-containing protein [Candidatus Angelobacter sp.]
MTGTLSQRLTHSTRGRVIIAAGLLGLAVMIGLGVFVTTKSASRPSTDQRSTRLVDVIAQTISSKGIEAGVAQYRSLRERGFPGLPESISDTNNLGYQFLGKGENQAAIQIFQLNVETHPRSSNAYDSLGEAYAAAGNKDLAIETYRKALEFNSENTNSKAALLRLTGRPATPYSPLLWFHIGGGAIGLLSGFLALVLRKGSRRHRLAGKVFAVSMMCMAGAAAWLAFMKSQPSNVLAGTLTVYFVATAWATIRRRAGETSKFDWVALLVPLAVGAVMMTNGVQALNSPTGSKYGVPAGMHFFLGAIALSAAAGDVRMLLCGGVFGTQRIARHLWRMCFGLWIAAGSVFLARQQLFPAFLRNTGALYVLTALPLLMMIFWMVRIRFTNEYKLKPRPSRSDAYSLRA